MKNIATAMLFSFSGALAYCQENAQPDTTYILDELVVSANRIPENKSRVAQEIKVILPELIQDLQAQTTADILAASGIVSVQKSQQGGGSPQLRGFEASRIVLVVDGVRMNNLIYRAGHLQNIITIDNNALERAEVILGPASTIYGSDALGGVVHLMTKRPEASVSDETGFNGNSLVRFGTVNHEKTGHFEFMIKGKNAGTYTSFSYSDFGDLEMGRKKNPAIGRHFGLRDFYVVRASDNSGDMAVANPNKYLQKVSGFSQYHFIHKLLLQSSDRMSHVVNLQYASSSDIPRYDRLTEVANGSPRFAEWYYGPQKRILGSYEVNIKQAGRFADEVRGIASYQSVQESRHDRRFNRDIRRAQVEDVDVAGLTIDFRKSIDGHDLRYGVDGQFSAVKSAASGYNIVSREVTPMGTRYPDGGNSMLHGALYATHSRDVNANLTLNDGIRAGTSVLRSEFRDKTFFPFPFDDVRQRNVYASGSAGLIYRHGAWKWSGLFSSGYRVPNVDDLSKVFETIPGEALIVPNPDLEPEKTFNIEAGVTRYFGSALRWESALYYTFFNDAIVVDRFTLNGQPEVIYEGETTQVYANQNKRRAYIRGLSTMLRAELSKQVTTDASLNYTYGRIRSESGETPLDHIPPLFGRVSISYSEKKFNAGLFVNFNGWKRIDDYMLNGEDNEAYAPAEGTPAWYVVNVRFGVELFPNVMLQTGIDNLFDLQYRTFSSGINAPGRNIFASLRAGF